MRSFRHFFRKFSHKGTRRSQRTFSGSPRMSSSGTAAALYAATVTPASVTGAVPQEVEGKKHHLKDGKGFTNPWDSWKEMGGFSIGWAMAKYVWCV